MLGILLLHLVPISLLYIIVNADEKSSKAIKKKRFATALAGMCLLNFVLIIAVVIIAEKFYGPAAGFKLTVFIAIMLFSLIVALWATKHIRVK
jgi:hypothetical protein